MLPEEIVLDFSQHVNAMGDKPGVLIYVAEMGVAPGGLLEAHEAGYMSDVILAAQPKTLVLANSLLLHNTIRALSEVTDPRKGLHDDALRSLHVADGIVGGLTRALWMTRPQIMPQTRNSVKPPKGFRRKST